MIIDGHQHLFTDYRKQISDNRAIGIDKVVAFPTIVHPENCTKKDEFSKELNKLNRVLSGEINPIQARIDSITELASAIKDSQNFFVGFGSCPFGLSYEETGDWFDKYIEHNDFHGIGEITTPSTCIPLLENIFKIASDQKKYYPLWIHTFNPLVMKDIIDIVELSKKYPNVQVILGHSAGSNWLETLDIVQGIENIYMDLSASFTTYSIKFIAETIPDRCIYSSDLPYGDPDIGILQVNKAVSDKSIVQRILGKNIQELLHI